jgi:hypothetical protein
MAPAYDFKLALTRVIKPDGWAWRGTGDAWDAAKFVGAMSTSRKTRPHWKYVVGLLLKAAETRKITDIAAATAQMECALRVEGWL